MGANLRKAIAVLRDEINTALKGAMKARDERRVSTLRLVNAAIKNADIEAETAKRKALSDDDLLGLLQKMIKQRQVSEAEAKAAIAEAIKSTGAQGMKDMGKVMAVLKQTHAGKMDFGQASGLVKALLSA